MPNAVYSGPWVHAHKGWFTRYIFTVTDNWAMVVAFVLGVVVLYAGDRSWALLRTRPLPGIHLVALEGFDVGGCPVCGNSIAAAGGGGAVSGDGVEAEADPDERIELRNRAGSHTKHDRTDEEEHGNGNGNGNDEHPDDPLGARLVNLRDIDFSPKDAIYAWIGLGTDKPRIRMLRNACSTPSLRLALALWAAFISVTTVGLAPFIPWLATERGLETPVVLSRYTTGCGRSPILPLIILSMTRKAERTYLDCFTSGTCQTEEWEEALPRINIRNATCPFEREACANDTQSVTFESHLFPKDLNYNSPSNLGLHRSMTCSPLELDHFFFRRTNIKQYSTWVDFEDRSHDSPDPSQFFAASRTLNGPNRLSGNYSGWSGSYFDATQSNKMQIDVIPRTNPTNRTVLNDFHPLLRRDNATTFVLLFYAGKTSFIVSPEGPIDDPIFKATRRYSKNDKMEYLPDREMTAVGCTEQYRFCHRPTSKHPQQRCTGWIGSLVEDFYHETPTTIEFTPPLQEFDDGTPLADVDLDLFLLYNFLFTKGSASGYARRNLKFAIASSRRNGRSVKFVHRRAQWVREFEAIFAMSLLAARLSLNSITAKASDGNDYSRFVANDRDFCGRMLLRDGDYTNFNSLALGLFFAVFSIPIVWSQCVKHERLIRRGVRIMSGALRAVPVHVRSVCADLKGFAQRGVRRCLEAVSRE